MGAPEVLVEARYEVGSRLVLEGGRGREKLSRYIGTTAVRLRFAAR